MFSIFKSKPLLKDLIPTDFVDIHSHLLFGIDDGAQTLEDTVYLLESMKQLGFEQVITTPHTTPYVWDNTQVQILDKHEEVCRLLAVETQSLNLKVASEYLMDASFVERLEQEKLLCLKDTYVLVEMSYINPPMQLFDILFALKSAGYEPVLAHPERYNFYHGQLDAYKRLKRAGCHFQMNLLSTTGYYGAHVLEAANLILSAGLVDFVGSDIHHHNHVNSFQSKVKVKDISALELAIGKNVFFKS